MPWASGWQFHVPLDKEDTGVADLSAPLLDETEALLEEGLVPLTVRETGAEKKQKNYLFFEALTFCDFLFTQTYKKYLSFVFLFYWVEINQIWLHWLIRIII